MRSLIKSVLLFAGSAELLLLSAPPDYPYVGSSTVALSKDIPFRWPERLDGHEGKIGADQIEALFSMLHPGLPENPTDKVDDVCDSTFTQGEGDPAALVAVIDQSEHGWCSTIEVVFCASHDCRIYDFQSDPQTNLEEQVGKFTVSGRPQILIQTAPSSARKSGQLVFTYHLYTIYPDGP